MDAKGMLQAQKACTEEQAPEWQATCPVHLAVRVFTGLPIRAILTGPLCYTAKKYCFPSWWGIFTCQGSEVEDILTSMAAEGIEIISCGACLSFYGLTEQLSVGTISNMYQIVTKMNAAAKTIRI